MIQILGNSIAANRAKNVKRTPYKVLIDEADHAINTFDPMTGGWIDSQFTAPPGLAIIQHNSGAGSQRIGQDDVPALPIRGMSLPAGFGESGRLIIERSGLDWILMQHLTSNLSTYGTLYLRREQ